MAQESIRQLGAAALPLAVNMLFPVGIPVAPGTASHVPLVDFFVDGLSFNGLVKLGNDAGDVTYPAALLSNRAVPMSGLEIEFIYSQLGDAGTMFVLNGAGARTNWLSSATLGGDNWSLWTPPNNGTAYAGFGTGSFWDSSFAVYDGVNEPTTARPNVVAAFWAYNETYNFGQAVAGEAAFSFRTETFFVIGTDPNFEFHLPEIITDAGNIHRLDSTYVSRTTGVGFREVVINDWTMYDTTHDPALGLFYEHFEYDPGSDTTRLDLKSQLTDGVTEITMGNWTDGTCSITYQDTEWVFNGQGITLVQAAHIYLNASIFNGLIHQTVSSDVLGATPNVDAIFEAQTVNYGMRMPFLSTVQRLAVPAVAGVGGLFCFDTTLGKIAIWTGAAWQIVTSV